MPISKDVMPLNASSHSWAIYWRRRFHGTRAQAAMRYTNVIAASSGMAVITAAAIPTIPSRISAPALVRPRGPHAHTMLITYRATRMLRTVTERAYGDSGPGNVTIPSRIATTPRITRNTNSLQMRLPCLFPFDCFRAALRPPFANCPPRLQRWTRSGCGVACWLAPPKEP